jgi:hypothetical protein
VLDADGKVLPAVREVLKICAEQKLVVQTGHLRRARPSLSSRRAATPAWIAWLSPMLSSRLST